MVAQAPYIPRNQQQPKPIADALRRVPGDGVMDIAHRILVHPDLFSCSRDSVLSKPLFYTDLKMPDQMSAHPHFLLNPQLLYSDQKTPLGESLVLMCSPPSDSEATRKMMAGALCPIPCYKKVRWYDGVLEVSEHGESEGESCNATRASGCCPGRFSLFFIVHDDGEVVHALLPSASILSSRLVCRCLPPCHPYWMRLKITLAARNKSDNKRTLRKLMSLPDPSKLLTKL